MSAASAFIEMPAERGSTTPRDGLEHFDMLPADPLTASFNKGLSRSTDEIGNFEGWPVHLLVLQHQPAEMGHGNLAMTHTYISTERQLLLRAPHA